MASYIFDLESDGFLDEATKLHSLVLKDIDTGQVYSYHGSTIPEGLERLSKADKIVGHNCIRFDVPVIRKLHPAYTPKGKVRDTLVMARLIHSNIRMEDSIKKVPGDIFGSHSLKAWGVRLGLHKQEYTGGFDTWSPTMQEYCEQDVEVGFRLYWHLKSRNYSKRALRMEHKVAELCAKMELNGFPFDVQGAGKLYAALAGKRDTLKVDLQNLFPPWTAVDKVIIPKRDNKTLGYRKGIPVTKYKTVSFNPASRHHIVHCFKERYGWTPKSFTEKGSAKVDEKILASLPYPEAKRLAEFFALEKLIGMIGEGDQAWLKIEKGGKIHASYNTMGAITSRASHSYPNIAQVPKVGKSPYGESCRSLFRVPTPDWVMLGSDMSGLELRCLSHFMAHWDNGEYAKVVTEGDVHTINQKAAGLPTRDNAKTWIYALLYGAGDAKLGNITGQGAVVGKQQKETFFGNLPALANLKHHVTLAAKKGHLKGLDGRLVPIRSDHAALNTLLQSTGAIICKTWITLIEDELLANGLTHGWKGDYVFLAWVHDEVQIAIRPELKEIVGDLCIKMAAQAGIEYDFKCPLTAEYKTGRTWAETH
jgi:DNA polymerase-1